MALMLISAGAGGATATVTSVDTSGTDATTSVSEVQTGTEVHMNNTTGSLTYQVIATNTTTDPVTKVVDPSSGFVAAENASMVNITGETPDGTHFNATIGKSALTDVEHSIGENVTVEWRVWNNSSAADHDLNTTAYLLFDNSTTVQNIDDSDVDAEDVVTVTNDSGPYGLTFGPLGTTTADVETDDRKVNGSETDVVIALSNQSALDMFDESVEDASSGDKLSTLWSGTRTVATVSDDDKTIAVPVYYESAPDDVEDSSTYAVYKTVGGTQSLVVNLGDSFEDSDEVSVNAIGSAGGTTMLWSYLSASGSPGFINTGAMLGMVPIVAGRRQRGAVAA
jgi:hypothetical protein